MAIEWKDFPVFELTDKEVSEPWLMAVELVTITDSAYIRIKAEGRWRILPGIDLDCEPDGRAGLPLAADALKLGWGSAGCLLGRFGGSSAGLPPQQQEGQAQASPTGIFAIGANCMVAVPADFRGPLFLGFNVAARPVKVESLKVQVAGAKLP